MDDLVFGLRILVDVLGAAGAVAGAIPVLREFRLKLRRQRLGEGPPIAGLEGAEQAASEATRSELERFRPGDAAYVGWGLAVISLSFALHVCAEVIERATVHSGSPAS